MKFIISLLVFINSLYALNLFKPVGFKATGMGGVGTANSSGAFAAYYNPALLPATPQKTEFAVGVGGFYRESNVGENLDRLADVDFDNLFENIANNASTGNQEITSGGSTVSTDGTDNSADDIKDIQSIQDVFTKFSSNNGLYASITPYISTQVNSNFAIGVFGHVDAEIKVNATEGYDEFIFYDSSSGYYFKYDPSTDVYSNVTQSEYETTSIEYAIDNNLLSVEAKGIMLVELPLTFAEVTQALNGYFAYGVNIKFMSMNYANKTLTLGSGSDEVDDIADNDNEFDEQLGIDIGIAYQPSDGKTIFGLMAKNVNSPNFKYGIENVKLEPAVRFGVSRQIFDDTTEIALDVDLTENDSLLSDDKNQFVGLGLEFHPSSWFSIRTGVMRDFETDRYDEGNIYSAGLGFGLKWGQLDLSVMRSQKKGQFDGDEIYRFMKVNVAFVSKWGSR